MKVTVVKKLEFPKGIDESYAPVWEEFLRMKAVRELRLKDTKDAIPDCFRLLLNQAKAGVRIQKSVKDYISFKDATSEVRAFMRRYDISRNMRVHSHKRSFHYTASDLTCAVFDLHFEGVVKLTPQRFDLNFNIDRHKGTLFREVPYPLSDKKPNGQPKKFLNESELQDTDYFLAMSSSEVSVYMYRTKKHLILRYTYKPNLVVPQFPKYEAQLKNMWRQATSGVI